MKYTLVALLALANAVSAAAVMSENATPKSYTVAFVEKVLPLKAKVIAISLQLNQAEAVRVRSLPVGWTASTFRPHKSQFEVAISLMNWGGDRGTPLDLADLNDKFWIVAILDDERPLKPHFTKVVVDYVLPPEAGKHEVEVKSFEMPSSSLRLTYVP